MDTKSDTINLDLSTLTGEITTKIDEEDRKTPVDSENLQTGWLSRAPFLPMSASGAKEWVAHQRKNIKPWGKFLEFKKFQVPKSLNQSTARVMLNVEHFQSNYLFVFIGLIVYCILTSPLLLIAIGAALGAAYIVRIRSGEGKLKLFGHELSVVQQYGLVAMMCFPLFYLAGAGSAVFWVLGASFFIIMLHAILYSIETREEEQFELQMENV